MKVLFTSLSGRYAHALFDEGKRASCLNEILSNFEKLEKFFQGDVQAKKLLTSCLLNKRDLNACWGALGQYLGFCPVFLSFIRQVVVNHRFNIIKKIKYVYQVALAKYKNKRSVTVLSAIDLLPEQKDRIEKLIYRALNEKIIINYSVDERILGGIKLRSEELDIDASVASQLKQLAKYFRSMRLRFDVNEN
ncbi:MAG: ATP synthase F1 subunit delta [Holosporales bacterium]|nr:ATP synthase F1 subunit delta [Holosporales bacterium]